MPPALIPGFCVHRYICTPPHRRDLKSHNFYKTLFGRDNVSGRWYFFPSEMGIVGLDGLVGWFFLVGRRGCTVATGSWLFSAVTAYTLSRKLCGRVPHSNYRNEGRPAAGSSRPVFVQGNAGFKIVHAAGSSSRRPPAAAHKKPGTR